MKKNILYIFICIITMVLFFGVAATCNLCGIPIEIGEAEDASNEDGTEDADEQDNAAVQDSGDDFQGNDNDGQDGAQGDNGDDPQEDEEANNDPVIDTLNTLIDEEQFYINSECSLQSNASDPDGDSLTYLWEVTGGTLDDPSSQNTIWTMPSTPGDYYINLTVSDGRGGEDTDSKIRYVTNLVYDFMEGAPGAHWVNRNEPLSFGGELNDSRGFATFRDDIILEDGETYSRVLETHPEWVDLNTAMGGAYISGIFPNDSDKIQIPAGARFTAKVGFIDGLTLTDGVNFVIEFYDGSTYYRLNDAHGIHCANDGALDTLDIDLSSIAGKSGQVILIVRAGSTSAQDWAVWVDPKITN